MIRNIRKLGAIALMLAVVSSMAFAGIGSVSAQTSDTGDVEIEVVGSDGTVQTFDSELTLELQNESGSAVDSVTVSANNSATASFSNISHGDYKVHVSTTDASYTTSLVTHDGNLTRIDVDHSNQSASIVDLGTISVDVVDRNDTAVANVSVDLVDNETDTVIETLESDSNGSIVYQHVEHGDYYFAYTYDGDTNETDVFTHDSASTDATLDVDNNDVDTGGIISIPTSFDGIGQMQIIVGAIAIIAVVFGYRRVQS